MKALLSVDCLLFILSALCANEVIIPSTFENNRIFVALPFNGVTANLLLDSGGLTGIYQEFAWYWKSKSSTVIDHSMKFGTSSPFSGFPEDTLQKNSIRLISVTDEEAVMIRKVIKDGLLGHAWLGKRAWKIDYPSGNYLF